MNVSVFLDLSDLYHRVNRRFGRKLDYTKVLSLFSSRGNVITANAYGIQRGNEASGFITCLQHSGFTTFFKYPEVIKCGERELKRANWEAGIVVDVLKDKEASIIILGTGSNNMAPLAAYLTEYGTQCVVFACSAGKELRHFATEVIEITEEVLE